MDVSKFIVGVLTVAIGLFLFGLLGSETIKMFDLAKKGTVDHSAFKLGRWNRRLTN